MVQMTEIRKKFPTKQDQVNFAREAGFFLPDYPGFGGKFFVQYLSGEKDLLPLGTNSGYNFKYFLKGNKFTKAHLFNYFSNDNALKRYIPDDATAQTLNRDFMFSVLAYAKRDVYLQLYNEYKQTLSNSNFSRWSTYGVQMSSDMANKVNEFISTGNIGNKKPFRVSMNRNPIPEIRRIQNQNHPQVHPNQHQAANDINMGDI